MDNWWINSIWDVVTSVFYVGNSFSSRRNSTFIQQRYLNIARTSPAKIRITEIVKPLRKGISFFSFFFDRDVINGLLHSMILRRGYWTSFARRENDDISCENVRPEKIFSCENSKSLMYNEKEKEFIHLDVV